MQEKKRKIIGIICARTDDVQEKQIIRGITKRTMEKGLDALIMNNLHYSVQNGNIDSCENEIYELILSPDIDGLIFLAESFTDSYLTDSIISLLKKRNDIPIVVCSRKVVDFGMDNVFFLNDSYNNGTADAAEHIISVHNCRDIMLIAEPNHKYSIEKYIQSFRDKLVEYDIVTDNSKIIESNSSDAINFIEKLIKKKSLPEALICTKSDTALKLLDLFFENGVCVPDDVKVIGLEHNGKRHRHIPVLTTFQQELSEIGYHAGDMLLSLLDVGKIISEYEISGSCCIGDSCGCKINKKQYYSEIRDSYIDDQRTFFNMSSQMSYSFERSRNLHDLIVSVKKLSYLIKGAEEIYICLREDWEEQEMTSKYANVITIFSDCSPHVRIRRFTLTKLIKENKENGIYRFFPIFFDNRYMGTTVVKFNYDVFYMEFFIEWLRILSNSLEIIRIRNDIHYLIQLHNITNEKDSVTGLYNESGFHRAYRSLIAESTDNTERYCFVLKIHSYVSAVDIAAENDNTIILVEIASVLKNFFGNDDLLGVMYNTGMFMIITESNDSERSVIEDKIRTIILNQRKYIETYGTNSFMVCSIKLDNDFSFSELKNKANELLEDLYEESYHPKNKHHYQLMTKIRNSIYLEPQNINSSVWNSKELSVSEGYFRRIYSNCFGVSYNQDCINARLSKAKYLLFSCNESISRVAELCGYNDEKFFIRQFHDYVGLTPAKYRKALKK